METQDHPDDASATAVDLVRAAVRAGLLDSAKAESEIGRLGGEAALGRYVASGALDQRKLDVLRQQLAFARRPEAIGGYRIIDVLGNGGMGVVYRAAGVDGNEVALKVIAPNVAADPVTRERFLREGRATEALRSAHVVSCSASGDDDGRLYLVFALMAGGTAEALVAGRGPLLETEALAICRDVARGLEDIHAAGLVHRDVKPGNIFLDGRGLAKLGDLGVARWMHSDQSKLTMADRAVGTPAFMAPEQALAADDVDIRADVYALASTLFFLLTGRAPFVGVSAWQVMSQTVASPIPDPRALRPDLSAGTAALIMRAGAVAREQRHPDPKRLREDLERALAIAEGLPPPLMPTTRAVTILPVRQTTVLLVDDDALQARLHAAAFSARGFAIDVAVDGPSALARMALDVPDLLVLDLLLAGMGGVEVVQRVRAEPRTRGLPVVVLTGSAYPEEIAAAKAAGADVVLEKSAGGPLALVEAVQSLLADRGTFGALPSAPRPLSPEASQAFAAARNALSSTRPGALSQASLGEAADSLRRLSEGARRCGREHLGALAAQAEALARALVAWPHHLNASSRRTLAQALARCAAEVEGGTPPQSPTGAAALVVDDDAISRITMTQVLEKAGFAVTSVSEAQTALDAAAQRPYRLVLSDVLMAGINGLQFAARLRLIDGCRDLPVIFVTALADFDTLFLQGDDPAADSIAKPFLPAELATKALTRMR